MAMLNQISNRSDRPLRPVSTGFTLIELMIVLIVLGLLSSVAIFSMARADSSRSYSEISQISATLQEARRWAILKQVPHKITVLDTGLELLSMQSDGWFVEKELNFNFVTKIAIEPLDLPSGTSSASDELIFLPDGSHSLFNIKVDMQQNAYQLSSSSIGQFDTEVSLVSDSDE